DQGPDERPGGRCYLFARRLARPFQPCPEKRLRRRRPVRTQAAGRGTGPARRKGIRRRGPLPRTALRQAVGGVPVPAVRFGRPGAAGFQGPVPGLLPAGAEGLEGQRPRLRGLRRLEHRPPQHRPEELAQQPEELRLPAARARLARHPVRRGRLGRRLPLAAPGCRRRGLHLVEQPRQRLRQQRGMAHRLPHHHPRPERQGQGRQRLQGPEVLRPRAADAGLQDLNGAGGDLDQAAAAGGSGWRNALAAYTHPRVLAMLLLGFSAGLPFPLVLTTLSARLRQAGIDRTTIGFFSLVGLAYSLKYFWAPIVDRLPLPLLHRLGRRRGWMLLAQCGIGVGLVLMALHDPAVDALQMAWLAVFTAFCSATQDIALDAWRIEAVGAERQGAM